MIGSRDYLYAFPSASAVESNNQKSILWNFRLGSDRLSTELRFATKRKTQATFLTAYPFNRKCHVLQLLADLPDLTERDIHAG